MKFKLPELNEELLWKAAGMAFAIGTFIVNGQTTKINREKDKQQVVDEVLHQIYNQQK